jgi:hypothetical protein
MDNFDVDYLHLLVHGLVLVTANSKAQCCSRSAAVVVDLVGSKIETTGL